MVPVIINRRYKRYGMKWTNQENYKESVIKTIKKIENGILL